VIILSTNGAGLAVSIGYYLNMNGNAPCILLIDDDPFLREMYENEYRKAGFTVTSFSDADGDIVQRVLDVKPDVITIDAIMPGRNGWDALEILKNDERTNHIPMFIACNQSHLDDVTKSLKLGAVDHIVLAYHKPNEVPQLILKYLSGPEKYIPTGWLRAVPATPSVVEAKLSFRTSAVVIFLAVLGAAWAISQAMYTPGPYTSPALVEQKPANSEPNLALVSDSNNKDLYTPETLERLGLTEVDQAVGYQTGLSVLPMLTWRTEKIREDSLEKSIDIEYPVFYGGPVVKSVVESALAEDIAYGDAVLGGEPGEYGSQIDFSIRYKVIGVQNGLATLELIMTSFTGGGNGNHDEPYVINWDLKQAKLVETSEELVCKGHSLSELEPLVRKQIEQDYDWILSGKALPPLDYLMPNRGGAIVAFKPYDVLSGSAGVVRVFLLSSLVKGIICLP
jgi:CheY-like chemotaxis protein